MWVNGDGEAIFNRFQRFSARSDQRSGRFEQTPIGFLASFSIMRKK
jgi:hypothetical protein